MIRACLFALIASAVTACAQQPPPDADQAQMAKVAEDFVNQRLAVWKQRLGLEEWKVAITMCHRSDLKPRTLGGIRWDKGRKTANMQVLAVSEYRVPVAEMLADMEFTVVHELIHLELASLPRSQASRSEEEQAVNQMATALLKLDRQAAEIAARQLEHP
ncbi:MAG: hypothetical protein ABI759_16665 [Candidatus Solibacter sp.]